MMHEIDPNPTPEPLLDADREGCKSSKRAGAGGDRTPGDVRVGRLDSLPAIRTEMSRVYRAARRVVGPNPSPSDATKLGWLLNALASSLVNSELAARVAELEQRTRR